MQILDLNQVMFSNMLVMLGKHTNAAIEEDLLRHMILNKIRSINVKFRKDFGNMIIASDGKQYWRKQIFPYYKSHRKDEREKSELNWTEIFKFMEKIKEEIRTYLPFPLIEINEAEADDIIYTLVSTSYSEEPVIILSGDKDMVQLQQYKNVKQYDPVFKRFLRTDDPISFLIEHIIRGDKGDGVPNILSDDDSIVLKKRQKPITKTIIAEIFDTLDSIPEKYSRNYNRNMDLIDMSKIPIQIKNKILQEIEETKNMPKEKLFNYFLDKKLNNLLEFIGDFK